MSDLMLLGILRMPENLIEGDALSLMQFVQAARGAADRIESDAKIIDKLRAELEAAAADKRDAERYRFLKRQARSDPKMNGQHVWYSIPMRNPNGGTLTGNTLDDAIDAALAQRQGERS